MGGFAMNSDVQDGYAVVDIDPYAPEFLANPYAFHDRLREAGCASITIISHMVKPKLVYKSK